MLTAILPERTVSLFEILAVLGGRERDGVEEVKDGMLIWDKINASLNSIPSFSYFFFKKSYIKSVETEFLLLYPKSVHNPQAKMVTQPTL